MSRRGRRTDHELLGRLASDDGDWGAFVAEYYPQVVAIAASKVKDYDEAQDITQEVMIKVVRRLRKGWEKDPDRAGFRALLNVIIEHCVASYIKRKKRQLRGGDELPADALLEKVLRRLGDGPGIQEHDQVELAGEMSLDRLLLKEALDDLSEVDRLVLTYDGKGSELAKELQKEPGTIRAQKFRAKKRLERTLWKRMVQWRTEPRPSAGSRFALDHLIWAGQLILDQRQETGSGPALLFRRPSDSKVESIRLERRTDVGRETFARLDPPLFDPEISGRHCRIEHRDGNSWWLEELGSTNKTTVNGNIRLAEKGDRVELCDGDRLEIGEQLLVFSTGELGPKETA